MIRLLIIFCSILLLEFPLNAESEVIILRDQLPKLQGTILSGGATGLLLREETTSGTSVRIPWSTIQSIEPSNETPQFKHFLEKGERLWRAKHRLLRGDIQLSEAIYASEFKRLVGTDAEDTRLASEGLLRVLIARGAIQRAVHPWLETIRLDELGISSPFTELKPIIDSRTMLCPHLPVFEVEPLSATLLESYTSKKNPKTSLIAHLLTEPFLPQVVTNHEIALSDSLFLQQIIGASLGDAQFMEALKNRMETLLPWQQAWAHYAIAIGLFEDSTADSTNIAMLHLATVASYPPNIQPWLSGAAMLKLSNALKLQGLSEQADRIQHEAARLFPSHPLLSDLINNKRNVLQ